ncbi:hypothetical protein [Croceimicrobium hydrocarbonivorans]|uniref:Response regulatory domain-containing protein n=1 Tax=Croceimicrobium hydrocarbonivorans TaxID=2761580 RepID=A0A7H0VAY3_9FLAO|nr:hypothetical protein [Croceimicrobium hydrocarbonivorans]QNR22881.1 hypothetical protein H4K34_10880 [Croceimicrobium hydrocarbonivorans]
MRVFLIDFSSEQKWARQIDQIAGLEFHCENQDGAQAYRDVALLEPDLVLVNMAAKASHGKQSAQAILKRKKTAQIPFYFLDCPVDYVETCGALGQLLSSEELPRDLEGFRSLVQ